MGACNNGPKPTERVSPSQSLGVAEPCDQCATVGILKGTQATKKIINYLRKQDSAIFFRNISFSDS